jgi:chaperonin GroES
MSDTLTPIRDRILVRVLPPPETTEGGIFMTTPKDSGPPKIGEIVSVGPGDEGSEQYQRLSVKTGDRILFESYVGVPIKLNDEELLMMKEMDVIGVLE